MTVDWNKWMKDHGIYIPTAEEIEKANRENQVKVKQIKKELKNSRESLEAYREKVKASR